MVYWTVVIGVPVLIVAAILVWFTVTDRPNEYDSRR
jgi:hypothetical protein